MTVKGICVKEKKRDEKRVLTMGPKLKLFSGWEMSQEAINCLKHRRKEAS